MKLCHVILLRFKALGRGMRYGAAKLQCKLHAPNSAVEHDECRMTEY